MPPIRSHEWLCLRAIKSRQIRKYSTPETSSTEQFTNEPPPIEASQHSPQTSELDTKPQSPLTPAILHSYLEKQDSISLTKLRNHFLHLQNLTTLSEKVLLAHHAAKSTIQIHPSLPPYTLSRSAKSHAEIQLAHSRLHARTQNILDNIWDLQNIKYPYEKGPSEAEKFRERVRGMTAEEKVRERAEVKNRMDGERKRFQQKVAGLEGFVDDVRRMTGREGTGRSRGFGSEFVRRVDVVGKKDEGESKAVEVEEKKGEGDTAVGTAKIEAEAKETSTSQFSPMRTTTTETPSDDTIGTTKIEADAEAAKPTPPASAQSPKPTPPTPYITFDHSATPMELAEVEAGVSQTHATVQPRFHPPPRISKSNDSRTLRNVQRAGHPSARTPRKPSSSGKQRNEMASLIASLKPDTQPVVGEGKVAAGYGSSATKVEEKSDPDERKPNPFARWKGK